MSNKTSSITFFPMQFSRRTVVIWLLIAVSCLAASVLTHMAASPMKTRKRNGAIMMLMMLEGYYEADWNSKHRRCDPPLFEVYWLDRALQLVRMASGAGESFIRGLIGLYATMVALLVEAAAMIMTLGSHEPPDKSITVTFLRNALQDILAGVDQILVLLSEPLRELLNGSPTNVPIFKQPECYVWCSYDNCQYI